MLKKILKSIWTALKGIAHGISKESNIIIQMIIALAVIVTSVLLRISNTQLTIIITVCFLVIILELINTSIEHLIDRISPKFDKEYGKVKDMMAGAVLLAALLAIIVGVIILCSPILALI